MPFGFCNATTRFQHLMEMCILADIENSIMLPIDTGLQDVVLRFDFNLNFCKIYSSQKSLTYVGNSI